MFSFLQDFGNYEERKVARYEKGKLIISTARVSDSTKPFETAVCHPNYRGGRHVIVELYDDIRKAKVGHKRWVETMTRDLLPAKLHDVSDNEISQLLGNDFEREFEYQQIEG